MRVSGTNLTCHNGFMWILFFFSRSWTNEAINKGFSMVGTHFESSKLKLELRSTMGLGPIPKHGQPMNAGFGTHAHRRTSV